METSIQCELHDLGRMPYRDALALQLSLVVRCRSGELTSAIVLVEHDPVITIGAGAKDCNLLLSEARLRELGVELVETDRGGDMTYHGPGQLVAYPIMNLRALGMDVHTYLRKMEDVVIDTLAGYGLEGVRHSQAGVWVNDLKVCSIGIAVRRSVAYHGLALNVAPNMEHFTYINPCGLNSTQVTSLARLLGHAPEMAEVGKLLKSNFGKVFNVLLSEG